MERRHLKNLKFLRIEEREFLRGRGKEGIFMDGGGREEDLVLGLVDGPIRGHRVGQRPNFDPISGFISFFFFF